MRSASPPRSRAAGRSDAPAPSDEPREELGELRAPGRPIVRPLVAPQGQLAGNPLVAHERGETSRAVEGARRVLPLSLPAHEQEAGSAAQPVSVVAVALGDVAHRAVEEDGVAALATAD